MKKLEWFKVYVLGVLTLPVLLVFILWFMGKIDTVGNYLTPLLFISISGTVNIGTMSTLSNKNPNILQTYAFAFLVGALFTLEVVRTSSDCQVFAEKQFSMYVLSISLFITSCLISLSMFNKKNK